METKIQKSFGKPMWLLVIMAIGITVVSLYLIVLIRNAWKQYDYIGKSEEFPHTIAINGKGKVLAIPDIAFLSLGLMTEKSSVSQAQAENSKKMNRLYDELSKLKIDKKDISTTQYNVYPQYDWLKEGRQTLRGYQVTQNVTVKIRDFEKIQKALELVGALELNQVGGLQFTIDDPEKIQQEARIKAIKNAKEKAEALSREAGVKLGKIVSFSEDFIQPPMPYYTRDAGMGMGGGEKAMGPIIEPGSQEINVQINVTYEIL